MTPFRDFLWKGAVGAACTAVLTLVGTVITTARDSAVHEQEIRQLMSRSQSTDQTLHDLNDNVHQLDVDVAVLSERLRKEDEQHVALQPHPK